MGAGGGREGGEGDNDRDKSAAVRTRRGPKSIIMGRSH